MEEIYKTYNNSSYIHFSVLVVGIVHYVLHPGVALIRDVEWLTIVKQVLVVRAAADRDLENKPCEEQNYSPKLMFSWCKRISRSSFRYFNYLVSATASGPESPWGHMESSSTVDFGWLVAFWEHHHLTEIVILWVYYIIPFGFSLFRYIYVITLFKFVNYFVWLRITHEDLIPKMLIWSFVLMKYDLK